MPFHRLAAKHAQRPVRADQGKRIPATGQKHFFEEVQARQARRQIDRLSKFDCLPAGGIREISLTNGLAAGIFRRFAAL